MSKNPPPRVFHLLHRAHGALFRAADRRLRESEGITTAHQVVLFTLVAEDGLASAEVARRAGHSRSRLTGLVDRLVEDGLVERRIAREDARIHRLHATAAGRALIARTRSQTQRLNAALLAPFDREERKTIEAFLEHVVREAGDV